MDMTTVTINVHGEDQTFEVRNGTVEEMVKEAFIQMFPDKRVIDSPYEYTRLKHDPSRYERLRGI